MTDKVEKIQDVLKVLMQLKDQLNDDINDVQNQIYDMEERVQSIQSAIELLQCHVWE